MAEDLPPGASTSRLRGVEGLRAIAAVSVVIFHVWRYSDPSGRGTYLGLLTRFVVPHLANGVTLFFALSGFLLYRPIAASVLRQGPRPGLRHYLRNRALRILPAYWVILIVTCVVLPAARLHPFPSDLEIGRLGTGRLLENTLLIQNYVPGSMGSGIGPTWSLAVELVFYLTLPVLGWLAAVWGTRAKTSTGRTWAVLVPVGLIYAIGFFGRAAETWIAPAATGYWSMMLRSSFLFHADLFAFGMALAVVRIKHEDGRIRLPTWWQYAVASAVLLVAASTAILTERGFLWGQGLISPYDRLVALASGLLLALVVLSDAAAKGPGAALVRLLEKRPLAAVGLASYSLFLWHEPLILLLRRDGLTAGGPAGFVLNLFVIGIVAGVLSALTFRYVERPALSLKKRRTRQPTRVPLAYSRETPSDLHTLNVAEVLDRPIGHAEVLDRPAPHAE